MPMEMLVVIECVTGPPFRIQTKHSAYNLILRAQTTGSAKSAILMFSFLTSCPLIHRTSKVHPLTDID